MSRVTPEPEGLTPSQVANELRLAIQSEKGALALMREQRHLVKPGTHEFIEAYGERRIAAFEFCLAIVSGFEALRAAEEQCARAVR